MGAERSSSGRFVKKSDGLTSGKTSQRAPGHSDPSKSINQKPSVPTKNPGKKSLRSLGPPDPANTSIVDAKRPSSGQSVTHPPNGVPPAKTSKKPITKNASNTKNSGDVAQTSIDPSKDGDGADEKRKLRSQGGASRSKSNLVHFFPDYEDYVFGEPKEPDFLTVDSTLFVVKDVKQHDLPIREAPGSSTAPSAAPKKPAIPNPTHSKRLAEVNGVETFDFSRFAKAARRVSEDPLSDEVFMSAHRRGERKEKQLRNIEKEHARHERSDLERLKDELQGPDWLKTMGVSGVTDTEKKKFEPKRDFYLNGVNSLLQKFADWDYQEKELKLKKEQALAAREDEGYDEQYGEEHEEEIAEDEGASDEDGSANDNVHHEIADSEEDEEDVTSKGPTDSSGSHSADGDPSARQLLQEAKIAKRRPPLSKGKKRPISAVLPTESDLDGHFHSFFQRPHLRGKANGKQRRGRSANAFGHPVPSPSEREFNLPNEYVSDETINANARKRRRLKRTK